MTSRRIALLVTLAVLVAAPYWLPGSYYVNIATQILIYAVFALAMDVLLGYGGLVSLGHAGIFGVAAYVVAWFVAAGTGHLFAVVAAIVITLLATAVYAVVALRATGIGFLMITLALGQILWGLAYRWISVTNGDNGLNVASRPAPFGFSLASSTGLYYATLVVFLLALGAMALFVASPFGASLRGTRDQPRRMNALGYHVWMIRFCACLFSGLLSAIAGILFVYYNQFISPQALALTASAEVVLMVISGGAGTLLGPIVGAALVVIMKNVASAYIARWNFLLGAIFVADRRLHAGRYRAGHGPADALAARRDVRPSGRGRAGGRAMTALSVRGLAKSFGGLRVTRDVNLEVAPGERRLIIGPNGAGKTTLFNLITGELRPDRGTISMLGQDLDAGREPPPRPPRHVAHLSDHHAVSARHAVAQRHNLPARPRTDALESAHTARRADFPDRARAPSARTSGSCASRVAPVGGNVVRRAPPGRDRDGARTKSEGAAPG